MVRPNKVEQYLEKYPETRGWYQLGVNIAEDGVIGPFNFTVINGEPNRIANHIWKAFDKEITQNKLDDIDTTDLHTINPLT